MSDSNLRSIPVSSASPSAAYYIRNVLSGTYLGLASSGTAVGLYPYNDDTAPHVRKWTVTAAADPTSKGVNISTDGHFLKAQHVEGNPPELFSHLATTARNTILLASNKPSDIDSLVEFYGSVATKLDASLEHPGNQIDGQPLRSETRPKHTYVLPAKGGDLLAEHLTCQLWNELYGPTSRVFTPDPEFDRKEGGRDYYRSVVIHSSLLARAFSLQPSFRARLWRVVEEVLIKCLFSGTMQEPGNFVVTAALIYGAGNAIREWLSTHSGTGKDWYQWDDVRKQPDAVWGWSDIVAALENADSLVDPEFETAVPTQAMKLFKGLKDYVGDGKAELQDWSAEKLAASYAWADDLPQRSPPPERPASSEYFGDITVLHPGDPGYDDEDEDEEDEG